MKKIGSGSPEIRPLNNRHETWVRVGSASRSLASPRDKCQFLMHVLQSAQNFVSDKVKSEATGVTTVDNTKGHVSLCYAGTHTIIFHISGCSWALNHRDLP